MNFDIDKTTNVDEYFMSIAIDIAKHGSPDEVPIGAVVVYENKVISFASNMRETDSDPTAHAEVLALRRAGIGLERWNLSDCTIYVTLEPCAMCAGAIINSRIKRLVYGATDTRFGAINSVYNIGTDNKLNHRIEVTSGILESECSQLLSDFFKNIRKNKKCCE